MIIPFILCKYFSKSWWHNQYSLNGNRLLAQTWIAIYIFQHVILWHYPANRTEILRYLHHSISKAFCGLITTFTGSEVWLPSSGWVHPHTIGSVCSEWAAQFRLWDPQRPHGARRMCFDMLQIGHLLKQPLPGRCLYPGLYKPQLLASAAYAQCNVYISATTVKL